MSTSPFLRSIWLPAGVTGILLLVALGILAGLSWHGLRRLDPVQVQAEKLGLLQRVSLDIEELLIAHDASAIGPDPGKIMRVRQELEQLQSLEQQAAPTTAHQLQAAWLSLDKIAENPRGALIESLISIGHVITTEDHIHQQLVAEARRDTEFEFRIAVGTLIVIPLVAIVALLLLRRSLLTPLNELSLLLTSLADQDYSPVSRHGVDPVLRPLFDNYNHLVRRLADLEEQNRAHRQSLEDQVRTATHALLDQQRGLATAERLAAVGEIAAGLAHELRNPLAGIQMALNNLNQEINNVDQRNRLNLVINELNRVSELLSAMLNQNRQEPEALSTMYLARAVDDLVTLVQYQIGENIQLYCEVPDTLKCSMPASRLHQVLLNLVLNAAQSIGTDRPGSITIRASVTSEDQVELSVRDDGPGFPQNFLENGIRPFVTGRADGTGLGLAVVQRFIHDLGGSMRLENLTPCGACVILTLPCRNKHG